MKILSFNAYNSYDSFFFFDTEDILTIISAVFVRKMAERSQKVMISQEHQTINNAV